MGIYDWNKKVGYKIYAQHECNKAQYECVYCRWSRKDLMKIEILMLDWFLKGINESINYDVWLTF